MRTIRTLLVCLAAAAGPAACADTGTTPARPSPAAGAGPGEWIEGSYSGEHGARSYRLYVPSGYTGAKPAPLVVMLHGCTQTAADFAAGTQMASVAESHTFLVAFPEQESAANANRCWNWFEPAHQARGRGEPALIAGIVQQVKLGYRVDGRRVFAAGMSAGGAMAVILGATYPDVFSAIGVHSGLEYAAGTDLASALLAQQAGGPDPDAQGELAYRAMGAARSPVRAIVFHGELDRTVAVRNGHQVLSQWAQTNDLADDGADDGSVDDTPEHVETGRTPAGYTYTRSAYASATGAVLLEKWIVAELTHAWSGGSPAGSYTNASGPSASREMWRFFAAGPATPHDATPPVLSVAPPGGVYAGPVTVALALDEPGTVFYTTDGSDPLTSPTRGSFADAGSLTLRSTATLRAHGVDAAGNASAVQSHGYTVLLP